MARFKTHAVVGGAVGFAAYCVKYNLQKTVKPETPFDFGQAVLWTGAGVACACLPDWLEPATSPNHRGFFHSTVVLGGILWCLMFAGIGALSTIILLTVATMAYASHLVIDAITPRSLPWLG